MHKWIAPIAAVGLGLFITGSAWACNTAAGQVTQVDAKSNTLVVNKSASCCGSSDEVKFALTKDTKVTINGKEAALADLKAGDKVSIDYEKPDEVLRVNVTRTS